MEERATIILLVVVFRADASLSRLRKKSRKGTVPQAEQAQDDKERA